MEARSIFRESRIVDLAWQQRMYAQGVVRVAITHLSVSLTKIIFPEGIRDFATSLNHLEKDGGLCGGMGKCDRSTIMNASRAITMGREATLSDVIPDIAPNLAGAGCCMYGRC
jgi:hypothetical protein